MSGILRRALPAAVISLSLAVLVAFGSAHVACAGTARAEDDQGKLFAIFTGHRDVYDACYTLAVEKVLTPRMREEILGASADREKGMACALGISSSVAGIRVTDEASLARLRTYFTVHRWCEVAKVDLRNAQMAVETYYLDNAKYPATLEDAIADHPVTFRSHVTYRTDANPLRYSLSATNDGCDRTIVLRSDREGFEAREKTPAAR